jgi:hypothetical protein
MSVQVIWQKGHDMLRTGSLSGRFSLSPCDDAWTRSSQWQKPLTDMDLPPVYPQQSLKLEGPQQHFTRCPESKLSVRHFELFCAT